MAEQVYQWKRFWCPRSGHIDLSDRGYLVDPESEWGKHYNPTLLSTEEIAESPCLVLLGEPGIGKTQAIQDFKNFTNKAYEKSYQVFDLDLRSYSSEDRLIRKLFECKAFTDWENGTHHLHLFLDSLDECLLRIDTLATLLVDEFKNHRDQLKRLHFRIACRTAVFPRVLEEGLADLWGQDSLEIYELAPLRRIDVVEAANAQGLDSNTFLEEIDRKSVVAFAIKPITLKFLLNLYKRHNGQFPPDQKLSDLYLEGCRSLCEEPSLSRRSSKLRGLGIDQRLIVAARVAAVTVFANRFAVWMGVDQGDVPDEDVLLRKLCQGYESANGREFEVTEAVVEEVLDTGLFSSRGINRMGWAHQTYAEFLAAWYLKQKNLKLPQLMGLIVHPDGRVVPQLHETVSWLAGMILDVFREVMKTDPDLLLRSDIATTSEIDKATLVESLLDLYSQEKLTYHHNSWLYEKLNHRHLANQLQPYICDSTQSISSRYVAIDIAETCNVQDVQESLTNVALDREQPYWLRICSARAVSHIGDEKTKGRLKSLALGQAGDDPEDELKGFGLKAAYPVYMTAKEVLDHLTQPRKRSFGGSYQEFLVEDFGHKLQLADLPVALKWVEEQSTRRELNYPFDALSDAILLKAWEYLEEPGILDSFARVALLRLKAHDQIISDRHDSSFKEQLQESDSKRRQLIEAIILILPNLEQDFLYLASYSSYSTAIVLERDFVWMLERTCISKSEQIQKIYAKLINRTLNRSSSEQVSAVIVASQNNSVLKSEFAGQLEPIELGSPRAEEARARYLELIEMHNSSKQTLLEPPPKERVLTALSQFEYGHVNQWCRLCREMTLMPTSTHYDNHSLYKADLTELPGWKDTDEVTRERIIAAAKKYIYVGDPQTDAWLGTNSYPYSALDGYQALRLILLKDSEFISTISADVWKKWVAIILDYSNSGEGEGKAHREILIERAYQNAPDEFTRVLMILINKENKETGSTYINSKIRHCWDDHLAMVILNKIHDATLTTASLGSLLKDLLINQVTEAKTFAESLITLPFSQTVEERERAIMAAKLLVLYAEDSGWSVVWKVIQQDAEFGREVIESVSYSIKFQGDVEQKLREDCIADLYIFLAKEYPDVEQDQEESSQDEEPKGVEAYIVGPEDSVKMWRDYIPQRLQERGTPEACEALRKIIRELPELKDKLQWRLLEAEALTRRQTWQPPQPEQVLQIIDNQRCEDIRKQTIIYANNSEVTLNSNDFTGANFPGVVNFGSNEGTQIGTQHNYASEQNLVEAYDEIQQIFNRLTQTYPTTTEAEKQIVVAEAVKEVKQNLTLMKRAQAGGKAFVFEALQKASDQWWVSPFVKAIEAGIKGE